MRTYLLLIVGSMVVFACNSEKQGEEYRPLGYYMDQLPTIKLSESGKARARAVWDSIRPLLPVIPYEGKVMYVGVDTTELKRVISPSLRFNYDSLTGPSALTLNITFQREAKGPVGAFWIGEETMVPCSGKIENISIASFYSQIVGPVEEQAILGLINSKFVRVDRKPEKYTITPGQAQAIEKARLGYEALTLLNNHLNKP
ncbi:hypothetical protein IC229_18435 [Spirosoma sp. BT702]|uniref:Uncharacterized protein n=1 Tax=Spirosoma profusum TaxID=2771354 RepID=A0A926XYQ9_9BACT|nr:hypothetical protein [Spirosoma profusum]MBD2702631.1 hypothetical protein [Spirosoma profusum]